MALTWEQYWREAEGQWDEVAAELRAIQQRQAARACRLTMQKD